MKTIFCFILLLAILNISVQAQWYNPDKVNKKAGEIYGTAYEAARDGEYTKAIKLLNEA